MLRRNSGLFVRIAIIVMLAMAPILTGGCGGLVGFGNAANAGN